MSGPQSGAPEPVEGASVPPAGGAASEAAAGAPTPTPEATAPPPPPNAAPPALPTPPPPWSVFQGRALAIGVIGCVLGAALGLSMGGVSRLLQGYLAAYLFWVALPLGSLALLLIHHLFGGTWGFIVLRPVEAAARTMPLLAVLFVPIALGTSHLYPWTAAALDPVLAEKAAYLFVTPLVKGGVPSFPVRAAGYFALWSGLAWWFARTSRELDATRRVGLAERMGDAAGPAMLAVVLSASFAAIDWGMSLEPHWYSTVYGLLFLVGAVLAAQCLAIATACRPGATLPPALAGARADLGKVLLTFVMGWAYLAFCQFLIIWSANLPEESVWYWVRLNGGWEWVAGALALGHAAIPFALLLSEQVQGSPVLLRRIALGLLVMHALEALWLVVPAFHRHLPVPLPELCLLAGLGGLWCAAYGRMLASAPLEVAFHPGLARAGEVSHG